MNTCDKCRYTQKHCCNCGHKFCNDSSTYNHDDDIDKIDDEIRTWHKFVYEDDDTITWEIHWDNKESLSLSYHRNGSESVWHFWNRGVIDTTRNAIVFYRDVSCGYMNRCMIMKNGDRYSISVHQNSVRFEYDSWRLDYCYNINKI